MIINIIIIIITISFYIIISIIILIIIIIIVQSSCYGSNSFFSCSVSIVATEWVPTVNNIRYLLCHLCMCSE